MKKKVASMLFILSLLGKGSSLNAYDPVTHREIDQRVSQPSASSLDQVLKEQLGLPRGITATFPGLSRSGLRRVEQLIGDGAEFEDASLRFFNHFHNPLRPWDQAGLRTFSILGVPLVRGQSSVLWQQNTSQNTTFVFTPLPLLSGGRNWSWQDARRHYLNALTLSKKADPDPKKEDRDKAFANTFEALGGLTHLLQDASVPAHVRNDPHPRPLRNPDWYEDWVEKTRVNNSPLFQSLLNAYDKDLHRPLSSIFTPTGDAQAPVPIARLMDTDKFLGPNFSVLTDRDLGITEYTNGNFLSRDTMFKNFDLPRQASLDPDFTIIEPVGPKFRRYFSKVSEGEAIIDHFVAEGLLHKTLKEALNGGTVPASGWTLDDRVHEDYAAKLLPRAVGYSASLLDYFFRGKLDVDLVLDPKDPSILQLSGTNGSPDTLVDGALALYADEPDGTRNVAPGLNPLTVSKIAPGQQIADPTSPRLFQLDPQLSKDPERFVAVYQGTLGNEVKAPANGFPGGVIGKVLGGVRAESIFVQGDKRMLRTVEGVFPLPPTTDDLQNVQWGDQDNTFVAIKSVNPPLFPGLPGPPDQVIAFKINRPVGSGEVPLVDAPDGTKVVSADILKAVNFPFDLPVGVTINYSQSFRVKQLLLTFDVIDTLVFVHTDPNDPNAGFYEFTSREVTTPLAEPAVDQTVQFAQSFPIVLDRDHFSLLFFTGDFFIGPFANPYIWGIQELAFDAQGHLLALVKVALTDPDNNVRTVNFRKRDFKGQLFETPFDEFGFSSASRIAGDFQASDHLWALIDVEKGEVLGVSSSANVSPSSEHLISRAILQRHQKTIFTGGGSRPDLEAKPLESWQDVRFVNENPDYPTVETGSVTLPPSGLQSLALPGQFRADLEALVGAPIEISSRTFQFSEVYFVDDFTKTNKSFRSIGSSSFGVGPIRLPSQAQIIRPTRGTSPELLYFFRQEAPEGEQGLLIHWSPQFPSNTALVSPKKLPPANFYSLRFTTSQAALIESQDLTFFEPFTLVVDLSNNKEIHTFSGQFLGFDYVLLDPKFLYNINDTKFHTIDPSLRPTALPRRLAPAPQIFFPPPAYHLVRLR